MGCGGSTANEVVTGPTRAQNITTVPVQRAGGITSRPLLKSKSYRHGSNITQAIMFLLNKRLILTF